MKTVLVFGNPDFKEDTLAVETAKDIIKQKLLPNVEFVFCSRAEDILYYQDKKELYVLDVAHGVKDVIVFDNINKLTHDSISTLHDFDAGFFLKLLNATGQVKKVKIIAIPQEGDKEEIVKKIINILTS